MGLDPKKSCVTQLLEVVNTWSEVLERGDNLDCIYLDFAKAFDTVPFKRLLHKLHAYGIRGKVHKWISAFLDDRHQQVRIGSSYSNWAPVKSGIPQGSVLGPTLFLIFINGLPDVIENVTKLFADDTKIYRTINTVTDSVSIQNDLIKLADWSDKWQLRFNASKCKCPHLGKSNPNYNYNMRDNNNSDLQIENITNEKDLGVIFDCNLNVNEHIATKIKKANQSLGMIRNAFTNLDRDMFLPLYKALIRPQLEYASVIVISVS